MQSLYRKKEGQERHKGSCNPGHCLYNGPMGVPSSFFLLYTLYPFRVASWLGF